MEQISSNLEYHQSYMGYHIFCTFLLYISTDEARNAPQNNDAPVVLQKGKRYCISTGNTGPCAGSRRSITTKYLLFRHRDHHNIFGDDDRHNRHHHQTNTGLHLGLQYSGHKRLVLANGSGNGTDIASPAPLGQNGASVSLLL